MRMIRWMCGVKVSWSLTSLFRTYGYIRDDGVKVTDRFSCSEVRERLGIDNITRMWANAQRDSRPAEYRWRPLFNAAKFG